MLVSAFGGIVQMQKSPAISRGAVEVTHPHAARGGAADFPHLGAVAQVRFHFRRERPGDAVDAAHGCEHRGLPVVDVVVGERGAVARLHEHLEVDGQRRRAGLRARARWHAVATRLVGKRVVEPRLDRLAAVEQILAQPALDAEIFDEFLAVLARERRVELVLMHGLRDEFRGVATPVGVDLAPVHLRKTVAVEVGGLVDVRERLQLHAEFAAVVERRVMVARDAYRARVEILPFVERAHLLLAASLRLRRAAAHAPAAPPGRARASSTVQS